MRLQSNVNAMTPTQVSEIARPLSTMMAMLRHYPFLQGRTNAAIGTALTAVAHRTVGQLMDQLPTSGSNDNSQNEDMKAQMIAQIVADIRSSEANFEQSLTQDDVPIGAQPPDADNCLKSYLTAIGAAGHLSDYIKQLEKNPNTPAAVLAERRKELNALVQGAESNYLHCLMLRRRKIQTPSTKNPAAASGTTHR